MLRFLSLVLLSFAVIVPVAHAQNSFAVVDIQVLMAKSKAAKDIGKQLQSHRDVMLKELSAMENKLVDEEKSLVEVRKTLPQEEFSKRVQDFEKGKIALQKLSNTHRKSLNQASLTAEKALMDEVVKIVEVIAKEKSYDLVLTKQNVIVGTTSVDVTDETLKRLDAAVPTIKVTLPKAG